MTTSGNTQSATVAAVATSTTVATLAAAGGRRAGVVVNDSAGVLYVKFGSVATASDWTYKIAANGVQELPQPVYAGVITGILDTGTGTARVTTY